MIWVVGLLALLLVADALRMRGRLGALRALPASDEPVADDHAFVTAPGVVLDEATRRAASAHARAEGLDVVDLVPRDLPAIQALSLAQLTDPATFRRRRLAPGRTAGHALLVSRDVATRAQLAAGELDEVALIRLAARLKRYAAASMDHAVAPAEHAVRPDLRRRRAQLHATLGPATAVAILVQLAVWTVLGLGVWLEPIAGGIALALWHLQPALAIAGTPIRSRDLVAATVLRAPIELYILVRTLAGGWTPPAEDDPVELRRPAYQRLLADGTDRFWEPRRERCPICDGADLVVHLRVRDLLQHKPGRFTLERCRGCGHVFQNPRLSLAGLDFYYKDFYDGLGEAGLEFIFGASADQYHARARMVRDAVGAAQERGPDGHLYGGSGSAVAGSPARWLDVGAGHGHFCCAARDELPATRFDGLDLSESIDEAHRRGWIDGAYRGLFPDVAPRVAGAYDVVSMSHYLEHTLDPAIELAAARTALAPEGLLLIELPDPEFPLGKVLGRWWLPWFQPQHLHLLSTRNLERLLRAHGFEPLTWHRGTAHQRVDFTFAMMLALGRLAPPPHLPWRDASAAARARRVVVWTLGAPLLVAGWLADRVAAPMIRRGRISNTYRVLARRVELSHG